MYKGGLIIDEQDFDDTYVRRYLDRFIQDNSNGKRTAFSHQANLKTVFYFGKDKEWAKLDLVDEYRRNTGKVLGVTMWYVILGYAISGCIFGLSIVNEYFYRIVYLDRSSTSKNPVLALETDSGFLEKARPHFGDPPDEYSVEELSALLEFWASPPNRLISDRANSILNKEARHRLDATILLFLAHAASLPSQRFVNDPASLLDSASDTSSNPNEDTLLLDHLSAVPCPNITKSDPVDIDPDDIDSESGDLTLAAYRDRLTMLEKSAICTSFTHMSKKSPTRTSRA
ncbi:Hypothetical protein CGB_B9740C [Cryptococcus gattii WM276]|uniref:Uncharacterized protein n=1 Tax=Cryptococcus gattii serotype B (strain WM276 / ATCC MYA-4071) TaxID=367775 RepID=E6R1J9_CRYGW|nr:Hypothetical protein CGB_B9740C [Cryptococcus gattii WM276]ADV20661.1 Hypothetical protein CGB_B9740C [Cryptococcus gattii WM276]